MNDYIRKAVELADGWAWYSDHAKFGAIAFCFDEACTELTHLHRSVALDSIAAQLVRQVDALKIQLFESGGVGQALVWESNHLCDKTEVRGPDRTMNTIKAIVDSGVLS